jgi:hypothetical protein
VASLNLTAIMSNPELCRAAQQMALMVAEQEALALPAPIPADHPEYEA